MNKKTSSLLDSLKRGEVQEVTNKQTNKKLLVRWSSDRGLETTNQINRDEHFLSIDSYQVVYLGKDIDSKNFENVTPFLVKSVSNKNILVKDVS